MAIYGPRAAYWTSILNLTCLIGFIFSYIVFVKNAVPGVLVLYMTKEKLGWLAEGYDKDKITTGGIFWGMIFAFGILFPMSITRKINVLRFSSLFGVICSMYLCLAVTLQFFNNEKMVENIGNNLSKMKPFTLTYKGVFKTFPLMIFAYMYQVNIPSIYTELEKRNSSEMSSVLIWGTSIAVFFYILIGIFGYATFVDKPEELDSMNILEADYHGNNTIQVGNFALLFAIITAAPLCVLPAKDSVEELFYS